MPQLLVPRLAAEFNSIGIRGGVERRTPYHAVAILYIYILFSLYFISHNHEIQQKRHKPTIPEPYPFQSHITQSISYHTVCANVLCLGVPQETIVLEKCNSNRSKLCNSIPCQPGGFSTVPHYHIGEGLQRRTLW